MSQIMNHREIEYFTKTFWKTKGYDISYLNKMLKNQDGYIALMNWLDSTLAEVGREDLAMDYGLDCLRSYLMFEKTPKANDPYLDSWDEGGLEGVYKFISKYRRLIHTSLEANARGDYANTDITHLLLLVKQMKADVLGYLQKENSLANRHNILSVYMEGMKQIQNALKIKEITQKEHHHEIEEAIPHSKRINDEPLIEIRNDCNDEVFTLCRELVLLMAPFAPYISEELWQYIYLYEHDELTKLSLWYQNEKSTSVCEQKWTTDGIDIEKETLVISIPVQVNARTRRVIQISNGMTREQVEMLAKNEIEKYLTPGMQYQVIYIPNKLINFVIK